MKYIEKMNLRRIPPVVFFPALAVFYEFLFQYWIGTGLSLSGVLLPALFAAALGALLGAAAELLPRKYMRWAAAGIGLALTTLYLLNYFVYDTYHMFMTPGMVFRGAQGVATDYTSQVVMTLLRGFWRIALMLIPPAVYGFLLVPQKKLPRPMAIGTGAAALVVLAAVLLSIEPTHDFEGGIRSLGLPAAIVQEYRTVLNRNDSPVFLEETDYTYEETTQPNQQTDPDRQEEVETIVYEPNVLPVDFEELAGKGGNFGEICGYIASQKPSLKNEYTGLFKGKNLILITAEAFTREVIDPVLTPTLYRLATQGIQFTDYYQPAWGGSTSGGEMSVLFGLVPDCSGGMTQISSQRPFITMGFQLGKEGYYSAAYHNNTGSFYDRNSTHIHLGYDRFITPDQGMQVRGCWPQSDLEMIDWTVPQYIDQQPFNIYYMTVSAHSIYEFDVHAMGAKNRDEVMDLPYSEPVKCYIAGNLELEHAMASLLAQLDAAGIMDDTVIVITADHYPYGLDESRSWGNSQNYLAEFFGITPEECNVFTRDHSALIIWSGCIEGMNLRVDTPTYSLDILPTLSNLFGLTYDSRMLVGRDVFSDAAPLVFWPDQSWITDRGTYLTSTKTFVPREGVTVDEGYISYISAVVRNRINYSYAVQRQWFLTNLQRIMDQQAG